MESKKLKIIYNQGYLLISAAMVIMLITVTATLLTTLLASSTVATINTVQSDATRYLAISALELAHNEIINHNKKCSDINKLYGNNQPPHTIPGFPGEFTIRCYKQDLAISLAKNLGANDTTIPIQKLKNGFASKLAKPLSSTETKTIVLKNSNHANFLPSYGGIVKIDNEYIGYDYSISKNNLILLKKLYRGINSTISTNHNTNAIVSQSLLDSGWIQLNHEIIRYEGNFDDSLTKLTRGIMGTKKTAHSKGSTIYQTQYYLYAEAGIPNLTQPIAKNLIRSVLAIDTSTFETAGMDNNHSFHYLPYETKELLGSP